MSEIIYTVLIVLVVLGGATAIAYFYFSTDIFDDILKRPLRIISVGMLIINIGVVLIAFLTYQASKGADVDFLGIPLTTTFYILYFIGSLMIIFGSRKFTRHINIKSSASVSTKPVGVVGANIKIANETKKE